MTASTSVCKMPSIGLFFQPKSRDYGLHVFCRKENNSVIAACHFQDEKNHKFFLIDFDYMKHHDEVEYNIRNFYGCGCPDTRARARDFDVDYDQHDIKPEVFEINTLSYKSRLHTEIGEGILKAIEFSVKTREKKRVNYAAAVDTIKEQIATDPVKALTALNASASAASSEEGSAKLPAALWGIFKGVLGGI